MDLVIVTAEDMTDLITAATGPEHARTAEGYGTPSDPETGSSMVRLSTQDGAVIGTDSHGTRYRFCALA